MDDRLCIANMAIEAGAKNGIFEVDEQTLAYVKEHSDREPVVYKADEDAPYDEVIEIDLGSIRSTVAFPHLPENARVVAELEEDEKGPFLEELGVSESGLNRLIKKSYHLLGLISYLTAGPQEVRAWTITKGTKAPGAAGKIHSDFERGFIRAEVIAFDDLVACGNMVAAKEQGLVRSEGKEYVMKDGDIVLFRFNV